MLLYRKRLVVFHTANLAIYIIVMAPLCLYAYSFAAHTAFIVALFGCVILNGLGYYWRRSSSSSKRVNSANAVTPLSSAPQAAPAAQGTVPATVYVAWVDDLGTNGSQEGPIMEMTKLDDDHLHHGK